MSLDCFQAVANSLVPDHFLETSTERERERGRERGSSYIITVILIITCAKGVHILEHGRQSLRNEYPKFEINKTPAHTG